MNFKPMSDEDIAKEGLIPDGTKCQAEVVSSELYINKESGKESIKVIFKVYHEDKNFDIWCFLTPKFAKLWKHAVVSMLGESVYNSGDISPVMFEGKQCTVLIGHDEYNGKPKHVITDIFQIEGKISKEDLPF